MEPVRKWMRIILDAIFPDPYQDQWIARAPENILVDLTTLTLLHGGTVLAILPFRHPRVRNVVHAAKYRNNERAAALLGAAIAPYLAEEIAERRAFGSYTNPLCCAIPQSSERHRERGYNQADRIAQYAVHSMHDTTMRYDANLLVRTNNHASQTQQTDRSARFRNAAHIFRLARPSSVAGQDIIVFDDVTTTGATFEAAIRALRKAGARSVLCVAAAH